MAMKIALMTNNYKPIMGGVPISIERLATGLRALGHDVTIFAPTYEEQKCCKEEEGVFRYATFMKHFIGGIVLPNPFDARIEREFREHSYDIIHVHHPVLIGRTAVYLSRKYDIPLVFTYHTRYEQYVSCYTRGMLKIGWFMPFYLHTFLKHCNFVMAPTPGMQSYLTEDCKVPAQRVGVLPTGVERANYEVSDEEADEIRRQYGAEGMPLLLTVSRMAHEKNVAFLLESLARVKKLYGKSFRMLMVGDGPNSAELRRRSEQLGLQENLIFTGTIPNSQLAPYFKAADAFLFASKTETQGIVVLEAFAGGTPVIAVKASGVEDLVDNGVNGILTGEDTEEYALKLTNFLNGIYLNRDADYDGQPVNGACAKTICYNMGYNEMGEKAFQKAEQYREEAVAMKAVHYYNRVIEEKIMDQERNIRLLPKTEG